MLHGVNAKVIPPWITESSDNWGVPLRFLVRLDDAERLRSKHEARINRCTRMPDEDS